MTTTTTTTEEVAGVVETPDYDPRPNATAKLMSHIAHKSFQLGSILGLAGVVPVSLYRRQLPDAALVGTYASRGALAGTIIFSLLGYIRVLRCDQEGIEDRVYRLHYNRGQNRTDLFSAVGSVLGAAGFATLTSSAGSIGTKATLLGGAAIGSASGVVLHVMTYKVPEDDRTPNRMIEELKNN